MRLDFFDANIAGRDDLQASQTCLPDTGFTIFSMRPMAAAMPRRRHYLQSPDCSVQVSWHSSASKHAAHRVREDHPACSGEPNDSLQALFSKAGVPRETGTGAGSIHRSAIPNYLPAIRFWPGLTPMTRHHPVTMGDDITMVSL